MIERVKIFLALDSAAGHCDRKLLIKGEIFSVSMFYAAPHLMDLSYIWHKVTVHQHLIA
jgi:hypothetical protein